MSNDESTTKLEVGIYAYRVIVEENGEKFLVYKDDAGRWGISDHPVIVENRLVDIPGRDGDDPNENPAFWRFDVHEDAIAVGSQLVAAWRQWRQLDAAARVQLGQRFEHLNPNPSPIAPQPAELDIPPQLDEAGDNEAGDNEVDG